MSSPDSIASTPDQKSLGADELSAQFARAAEHAGGVVEETFAIGGQNLRLRAAGRVLLDRLTPSISHLRTEVPADGPRPDREHIVELWDGESTDTDPPPAPPGAEDLPPAGIATSVSDGWRAIYQAGVKTLSVTDTNLDRSWYWAASASILPEWECSTPLRHILHLWLASRGVQFVHAGAVGRPEGGFIIVGKSGSGKSSSTLSTLGSSLLWAGDDYVGVSNDPETGPYVHSIYSCAKLETGHVTRFPDLKFVRREEKEGALAARRDKTIFYVGDTYPEQVTSGFPLKGIIVPRVSADEATQLTDIPLTRALKALVPSTLFEIHAAGQEALTTLTQVIQKVRTLELRLGTGMSTIPELLGDELEHPSS